MNIWRRGSLTKNPYARTAFRVARVPREITRYGTIVRIIGQTKQIVKTDQQAHTIRGEPVSYAEVNTAERILLDHEQRIAEDLLEHATEMPPLDRVRKLAEEAAGLMASESARRMTAENFGWLQSWMRSIVSGLVDDAHSDPSFGALEMEVIPPFGKPGER